MSISVNWVLLGSAVGIPLVITFAANFARRLIKASTSTGGDIILTAIVADAGLLLLVSPSTPFGLALDEFRLALIFAAAIGCIVFLWSTELQSWEDAKSHREWALTNYLGKGKKDFAATPTFSKWRVFGVWFATHVYLAVHISIFVYL